MMQPLAGRHLVVSRADSQPVVGPSLSHPKCSTTATRVEVTVGSNLRMIALARVTFDEAAREAPSIHSALTSPVPEFTSR